MTAAAPWRDPWVVGALLAALALRLAMARGGLWLDEAWSAVMANEVGTPLGVLTGIHHDNNHPLNSWWLQLVGLDAPPLLARALSIGCSVATILPAAAFARRRSTWAGRSAAWLFALSPMLVLLGSEARGYAPALLAAMLLIERIDPLRLAPPSPTSLALIGLLGTLGHLLMLPAIILCGLWLGLAGTDWRDILRRIGPSLAAAVAAATLLLGPAFAAQGGLTIGSTIPFSWPGLATALVELARLSLGFAPLLLLILLVGPRPRRIDLMLWLTLGLGLQLAAGLIHPANSHISRYYVVTTLALLLLAATRSGALAAVGKSQRRVAGLLIAATLLAMTVTDVKLIATARAEPNLPVQRIVADRAGAARVLVGASRLSAVVTVAATQQHAVVTPVGPACAPADYLLIDREDRAPTAFLNHCGRSWSLLDHRLRPYRDGAGWALYSAGSSSTPLNDRAGSSATPLNDHTGWPAPGVVAKVKAH